MKAITIATVVCLLGTSAPALAQTEPIPTAVTRFLQATPAGQPSAARANTNDPLASVQGFSVVLVLGDAQGSTSTDPIPTGARAALADMKDFLPYKSYRVLDTAWIQGSSGMHLARSRVRGPDSQDYLLSLIPRVIVTTGAPTIQVGFTLADPGETFPGKEQGALPSTVIQTTFSIDPGETVVVGTSRVKGDKALIALLTAVRRGDKK